jgi:hypothetical protein
VLIRGFIQKHSGAHSKVEIDNSLHTRYIKIFTNSKPFSNGRKKIKTRRHQNKTDVRKR